MKIDVKSDVSCYVKIGEHTFYLEVSSATENKPYVIHWDDGDDTSADLRIKSQILTIPSDVSSLTNFTCDFCEKEIENDSDGSCFLDGTAFCHLDFSDDVACKSCYEKGLWHKKNNVKEDL